jgi:hypothetical protein
MEPETPAEELACFRAVQTLWRIRRIDHIQAAFFESRVDHVRERHPNAAPAAAMATIYMGAKNTEPIRFLDTTERHRRDLEHTLHRQLGILIRLQSSRRKQQKHHPANEPAATHGESRTTRSDSASPALLRRKSPLRATDAGARQQAWGHA